MSDRGWERVMLLAGTAVVALFALSIMLPGQVHGDESASEIVGFLMDNRTSVLTGIGLQIAIVILFFVFLVGLNRVLRRSEKEPASLSTLAFTAGFIGGALLIVSTTLLAGVTQVVATQRQQSDANVVWALVQVYESVNYSEDLLFGVFVLATSFLLIRSAIGPRWIGWFGFLPGLLFVLATFTVVNPDSVIGLAGLFANLLFALWLLFLSLFMLPRAGATETQATAMAAVQA